MKRAADDGGDTLGADSLFHACILRASGNGFFAQMVPMVDPARRMTIRASRRIRGVKCANIQDRVDILDAISAGKPPLPANSVSPAYPGG